MKLTTRGFTLVELMIVIAIIGILAAALFPSMTNYLKRSRDAARTSNLKDITTALGAFYADAEKYPDADTTNNCVATASAFTGTSYFPKGYPTDPQGTARALGINGCLSSRNYGYNTGTVGGVAGFQVVTWYENTQGGNTGATASGVLDFTAYTADFAQVKWAGATFILGN